MLHEEKRAEYSKALSALTGEEPPAKKISAILYERGIK
jgi:hypothetical protein